MTHVKLYDRVFRRLSRSVASILRTAPYDAVQLEVQKRLHLYLRKRPEAVRSLVMVGAHVARALNDMLRRYPNLDAYLFEASPRYTTALKGRFARDARVSVFTCAVGNCNGTARFFETNLAGSGSLLQVGPLGMTSYGMVNTGSHLVECVRLDDHARCNGYSDDGLDCLWIDVQGAEMGVLEGARETLDRARSVMIEVSMFAPLYEGGATFDDIAIALSNFGFKPMLLGTDHVNGTGNAFFLKASVHSA